MSGAVWLAVALAGALLAVHLLSVTLVLWRLARRDAPAQVPRVTLLRPVRGLEHRLEETLESGFLVGAAQVIHCVEDADDPAVPLIRRLMAAHPGTESRLEIGRDPVSGNPKLNNLVKGWRVAQGDWVVMADSNLLLPPDYLARLFARQGPGVGMLTSPAFGDDAQGFWARVEAGFLNTYQARWQLAGDAVGAGFAQGKTLAFPRDWLNARGGVAALAGEMAEDVASTRLVRGAGLRVRLARAPFAQPLGRRDRAQVWARQARWAQLRRDGVPAMFALEPLTGPALPLVALALAAPALILPFAALWYGAEWALARRAGWPAGAGDLAAWVTRDAMLPFVWAAGWRRGTMAWRGNEVTRGA